MNNFQDKDIIGMRLVDNDNTTIKFITVKDRAKMVKLDVVYQKYIQNNEKEMNGLRSRGFESYEEYQEHQKQMADCYINSRTNEVNNFLFNRLKELNND